MLSKGSFIFPKLTVRKNIEGKTAKNFVLSFYDISKNAFIIISVMLNIEKSIFRDYQLLQYFFMDKCFVDHHNLISRNLSISLYERRICWRT